MFSGSITLIKNKGIFYVYNIDDNNTAAKHFFQFFNFSNLAIFFPLLLAFDNFDH